MKETRDMRDTCGGTILAISVPLFLCGSLFAAPPEKGEYFQIKVIDEQTGRGVPLIELSTTHNLRLYTDSQGVVALYEPGLLDQDVRSGQPQAEDADLVIGVHLEAGVVIGLGRGGCERLREVGIVDFRG